MKTAVVVTLIAGGVVVVAIPAISSAWRVWMQTQALTHGASLAPWEGDIGDIYRIGCYVLGAMMIGVGVLSTAASFDSRSTRFAASAR